MTRTLACVLIFPVLQVQGALDVYQLERVVLEEFLSFFGKVGDVCVFLKCRR